MLLVIFGAGASYDSVPRLPPHDPKTAYEQFRPPLANQLFEDRFGGIKRSDHLPAIETRMLPPNSVEAELENLLLRAQGNPEIPKQLAAVRYYLQDVIAFCQRGWKQRIANLGGATNYWSFIDEIEDWRQSVASVHDVFLVTFNYDTLLEDALGADSRFRMTFKNTGDYVSPTSHYKILKPHGSANWAYKLNTLPGLRERISGSEVREAIIDRFAMLQIPQAIRIVNMSDFASNEWLIPALAIPVERSKTGFICPEDHMNAFSEFLPSAKKLVIVGWRAAEQTFLGMLTAGLSPDVRTRIVSRDHASAGDIGNRLREAGLKGELKPVVVNGFTEFTKKKRLGEFLNE
jgi:hypothetical protein